MLYSADKSQLYKDNYTPLIKGLKQDIERWSDLKINLIGRINLIKLMWLPKFLYIFQLLYCSREEGGLNLPNLEFYHNAAQMFYIDHIINNTNEDPWIDIENHQLQPKNLLSALFSKQKPKTVNFVINSTFNAWSKMEKILGHQIEIPKHIQIWNNPSITIQRAKLRWETWMNSGIWKLSDIINQQSVLSFQELKNKYELKDLELFKYLQLKNWITENLDLRNRDPTEIGEILRKKEGEKKRRLIGSVYNILIKAEGNEELLQNIHNKWNIDLGIDDAGKKWKECLRLTNRITTNENLRLIQYKLMTRIYYSRDKIHKFDNSTSDRCVKCSTQSDSLIHAFWYCEKVRKI